MNHVLLDHPAVHDCCKQAQNRQPHREAGMGSTVSCEKCQVCGRRHFSMTVEPLILKGRMA